MSKPESDWLALREPPDHAARCGELARRFAGAAGADPRVIDLACGTGSNLRYLHPKLGPGQRWLGVDDDPDVLARAAAMTSGLPVRFERRDLARDLTSLALGPGDVVTMSAFLDMTSAAWIDQLAAWCRDLPLLAASTFDGQFAWRPARDEDEVIQGHILARQRQDKGFGPALGGDAAPHLAERLEVRGQQVDVARSDWHLGPDDRALLRAMVDGVARAVRACAPDLALDHWSATRKCQIEAGELRLVVGHVDLLALPG